MTPRTLTLLGPALLLVAAASPPAVAQFTEAAQSSGLRVLGTTWGAAMGDLDGDGDLEIVGGRHLFAPVIFWNDGGAFQTSFPPQPFTGPTDRHGMLILPLDEDGDPDVLIVHGAGGGLGSEPNELYLNDGAGVLSPLAGAAGLDDPTARARCASAADFDGDGRVDVWIGNAPRVSDPNSLFRNDGPLAFADVASIAGLDESFGTVGGLWGDFDDDGDPDLFVGGEEFLRPSVLWRNDGGTFADVSSVFSPPLPVISGADCGDFDNDGDLDLAVCDGGIGLFDTWAEGDTVSFYFNSRYGENGVDGITVPSVSDTMTARFRYVNSYSPSYVFLGPSGVHPASGFSVELTDEYVGAPTFTPGVDLGTFVWRTAPGGSWEIRCSGPNPNFDAFDGFLVGGAPVSGVTDTDLEGLGGFVPGGPRVWRNDGGAFTEITSMLGLPPALLNPRDVSWVDYDNDGDLDLHVVDLGTSAQPNAPDALFNNVGSLFLDATATEGLQGGAEGMGDGGVWGDVDDDGDLDLFLQEGAGPVAFSDLAPTAFYRNDGERGASIRLDLTGTASGPPAVGARVTAFAGALEVRRRVAANSWRGFQDPLRVHLGLGAAERADSVVIEWPSGAAQSFRNPFPGRYAVSEDDVPDPVDVAISCLVEDPGPVPGDTVRVHVAVASLAGSPVSPQIAAPLPPELLPVSFLSSAGTYDWASGSWSPGTVAAAESLTITAIADPGAGGLSPVLRAALVSLPLDRPDTLTSNDASEVPITLQAVLALSSAADLQLPVGATPLPAESFVVTDGSAPAITAANDVRVRIPAGFPMEWDEGVSALALSGPAAAKVSPSAAYEDSARVLVLDVLTDFAAGDRLLVSGAAFANRSAPASGRLELEVDGAGTVARLDDKTVTVFAPTGAPESPGSPALLLRPPAPNPFLSSTAVRYDLPREAPVRLSVHDVTGRRIRELVAAPRSAGRHSVIWDGRDGSGERVAAGVYFVRLSTPEDARTRKIVLLR